MSLPAPRRRAPCFAGMRLPRLDQAMRLVALLEQTRPRPKTGWWELGGQAAVLFRDWAPEDCRERAMAAVKEATGLRGEQLTRAVLALARLYEEADAAFERAVKLKDELSAHFMAGVQLKHRQLELVGLVEENRAEEAALRLGLERVLGPTSRTSRHSSCPTGRRAAP